MEAGGKRAVEVAHRRWGKDDVALHFTAVAAMQRVANYWHMLPQYSQARKVVWNAVNPRTGKRRIDEAFPPEIRSATHNQEMSIDLVNGSIWQLVGSDNYNTLVGSPPAGIVFSEWALANPMAWAYLAPVLEENGGWALWIYTSRGNNHGKTMLAHAQTTEGWFSQKLPADETPVFKPEQLDIIKGEYQTIFGPELGEMIFEQEYFCSFEGAVYGSYYAKQMAEARKEGRICPVPHNPSIEVDTFFDLGVDDSMAIWFMQPVGREYRFVDYYENTGYGLEHYAKKIKEKPYTYGNHWMPHDASIREMTNNEIALSRKEVAENLGIKPITVVQRARNMDTIINVHIPAVRSILSQCVFDEKKCDIGIRALEGYHAEYDEEKKVLGNRPAHDWCSHGADAFRTFAVGYKEKMPDADLTHFPNYKRKEAWLF